MATISISAKCSDCFGATLTEEGKPDREYDGYVPMWLCNDTDTVELTIDLETGKIVGWEKPSEDQLEETFGPSEDEEDEPDLLKKAREICEEDGATFEVRKDYSGRGMFGGTSTQAFTTDINPNTIVGAKIRALGFNVDSMGRDSIYYTRS
jgi:hypothetical protein